MTNLTEQWKKGELQDGEYWVEYIYGDIERLDYCLKTFNDNGYPINKKTIKQILAKMPSYEEWKAITDKYIMFIEHNQILRRELEEEKAKNRIDYYTGSPMDYLDECERARRKNKIFQNWIKNINKELLTSELRKTKEGNLFIVNLLKKIDQVLGEE